MRNKSTSDNKNDWRIHVSDNSLCDKSGGRAEVNKNSGCLLLNFIPGLENERVYVNREMMNQNQWYATKECGVKGEGIGSGTMV